MNFGTDFLIVDGEFVWQGDNLATVSGEDNVKQQAYLRLLTDAGESIFFKEYGSRLQTYLSKPFNAENKQKVEAEARAALLQIGTVGHAGWIEQVLECRIELVVVEGKQVKMLFVKYLLRGDPKPRSSNFNLEV